MHPIQALLLVLVHSSKTFETNIWMDSGVHKSYESLQLFPQVVRKLNRILSHHFPYDLKLFCMIRSLCGQFKIGKRKGKFWILFLFCLAYRICWFLLYSIMFNISGMNPNVERIPPTTEIDFIMCHSNNTAQKSKIYKILFLSIWELSFRLIII